ncbi:MAG: hypothetical protein ACKVPX_04545 [Myxococcaceae bacterium]
MAHPSAAEDKTPLTGERVRERLGLLPLSTSPPFKRAMDRVARRLRPLDAWQRRLVLSHPRLFLCAFRLATSPDKDLAKWRRRLNAALNRQLALATNAYEHVQIRVSPPDAVFAAAASARLAEVFNWATPFVPQIVRDIELGIRALLIRTHARGFAWVYPQRPGLVMVTRRVFRESKVRILAALVHEVDHHDTEARWELQTIAFTTGDLPVRHRSSLVSGKSPLDHLSEGSALLRELDVVLRLLEAPSLGIRERGTGVNLAKRVLKRVNDVLGGLETPRGQRVLNTAEREALNEQSQRRSDATVRLDTQSLLYLLMLEVLHDARAAPKRTGHRAKIA